MYSSTNRSSRVGGVALVHALVVEGSTTFDELLLSRASLTAPSVILLAELMLATILRISQLREHRQSHTQLHAVKG